MKIKQVLDDEKDFVSLQQLAKKCGKLDVHTLYTYWSICHFFHSYCFFLTDNEEDFGYIMCLRNEKKGFIWQIGILEKYRQRRLSYQLIDAAIKKFRTEGILEVQVSIDSANIPSNMAFSHYCLKNNLSMTRLGQIGSDEDGKMEMKTEELYEIGIE